MDKALLDMIKRQQESMDWAKSIAAIPTIPESLQKTLSAASAGDLLASQQAKLASSIISSSAMDRLKMAELANITAVPSIFKDAGKYKSLFATDSIALHAAAQMKFLSGPSHLDLAFKNLSGITGSAFIADAIARMNPVLPSSFISQYTALDQFKGLADTLRSADVFGESISKTLRASLGDWREQFVLPALPQTVYETHGFNTSLTELPSEVFYGIAAEAGLTDAKRDIELFGPVVKGVNDEDLSQEELNTRCYQRIFRLENRFRTFVEEAMTKHYGEGWFKQLPGGVKQSVTTMREKKAAAGEDRTLVQCTDFSHYLEIVNNAVLWKVVFQPLFGTTRKADVIESLNRLKPVRDTAMHSNFVTREDWLMLWVETNRLLAVITKTAISG